MVSSSLALIGYSGPTIAVLDLWLFAVGLARGSVGVLAWLVLPIALGSLAVWVRRRFFTPAPRHAADLHAAPMSAASEAETTQWRLPRPLAAGAVYISHESPVRQRIIDEYDSSRETVSTGLSVDEAAIVYELGKAEERSKHRWS